MCVCLLPIDTEMALAISMIFSGNYRIGLNHDPVKFGNVRSKAISKIGQQSRTSLTC